MALANGISPANGSGSSRAAKYDIPAHFVGGNCLENASPSNVKDFVGEHEGHSVISSVSGRMLCAMRLVDLQLAGF